MKDSVVESLVKFLRNETSLDISFGGILLVVPPGFSLGGFESEFS